MKSKPDDKMTTINDKTFLSSDILIVDDEIPNLKLLSELLGHAGYQVRSTEKAQLAIDSGFAKPPALILLDVRMPEMDGYEVCKRLKQNAHTSDIPIIFISALQEMEDKVQAFEAGGVDFISKPFQEEEVLARVRTHLELRNMQLNLAELVAVRTAELHRSEAKYRDLVDNSIVGVFTTTIDGRLAFLNDAMVQMFDFDSPEQMIAKGSLERWKDPKDRERMLAELQEHGRVTNFEVETVTHTGRNIHVLFSAKLQGDRISGMIMDITARKQAEEALRQSHDFLEHLTSAVPDAIFSIKMPERTINWANDSFNVMGYEPEEYIGQSTKKFYANPEDYDAVGRLQQDAIRKGDDMIRTEVMALRKDGRVIPAELTATYYWEEGKLSLITALVRDISERKLAEEKLVKSEAKYRSLVDNSIVGVFESTADGRFTFVNDAMAQMFDFDSPEQMIAKGSLERWKDPKDRERMLAELQKHGRVSNFESEAVTHTGRHIHALFSAKQLGDCISGMVMDISDRKQAEEEIRKLNEDLEKRVETRTAELKKLSEAVEQSPVIVVITDKNGTIEYVNPRFSKVTGYTAKEAIGQNPRILKAGDKPESFYKDLWDTILSGRTWRGEFLNRKKNDEEFWESASISPIKNNDGEITHLVAVKQDITEKKRIEEELLQSKLAAEEANQAKSMFLANMSHELRTPLNAILGFSQMLAREPDGTADQKEKLTIINRSGEHLLSMINDVLDLSKIEAGRVELEAENFDLKLMLEDIGRMFALRAKNGGLDFELSIDVELVRYVRADSGKLRQILINLLSNAVKFTDQGGVSLRAQSIPIPDGPAMVRLQLEVEDSGSGISPELVENIFEPFYQVSKIQASS